MTVSSPPLAETPARRRWGIAAAVLIVIAVIGYLAFAGIGNALVYYLTPTELMGRGEAVEGQVVRLGGLVEQGSLQRDENELRFVVTDGTTRIAVRSAAAASGVLREGTGVVAEGSLDGGGTFRATEVLVKHDENYVAPSPGELPEQPVYDPPAP